MSNIQILDANGAIQSMKTSLVSSLNIPWHILSDGTLSATLTTRGAVNTISVQIVDASGNQVTGFGGTEYNTGATVATPAGKVALGNYSGHVYAMQLDGINGNLLVSVANTPNVAVPAGVNVNNFPASSGVTQVTTPWVVGQAVAASLNATVVFAVPQHVIVDSASSVSVTQGTSPWVCSIPTDVEVVQDTAADFNATVVFASPQHTIVDSGTVAVSSVAGTVAVTQSTSPWVVSGTVTANAGTGSFTVAQATAANLNATVVFASPQHIIVDSGTVAVTNAALAATGAAAPAAAAEEGLVAATALPTAVTNGQLVGAMGDVFGRQVVLPQATRDLIGPISVQTTTASYITLIAAIASVFTDISALILTNESATATIVSVTDGTVTYVFALAGNGGGVFPFSPPLPASTVNTVWQIKNSAAVAVDVVGTYVKNK